MPKSVHADYFEAIIQIRPFNEDVLDYVVNLIDKRKDFNISKIIEKKFGVDLYVSDRKYALAIGKKLKDKFKGGILKTSRTLYGYDRQTSKKIYRVVVCFRYENKEEDL